MSTTPPISDTVSVKAHGAVGDWNPATSSGTDDRAAIMAAIAEAKAKKMNVRLPPGNYRLSKAILIEGVIGLKIFGSASSAVYYPSDDLTLIPDATFINYTTVRSGFLIRNSRNVTIEDIEFVGGDAKEIYHHQTGHGICASRCVGTRILNCRARGGYSLFAQEARADSTYTHDNAIAVSGGVVTLTNDGDPNGAFHAGMVGRSVTIANAADPVNNGVFPILTVPSSTQLTYRNAAAVAESAPTSPVIWVVNDGDDDTLLESCRSDDTHGASTTGNGGVYRNCTFQRPMTQCKTGIPDSFSVSGTTVTMTDATGSCTPADIGRYMKIAGATSAANNGIYLITGCTAKSGNTPATVVYSNASGVVEAAPPATAVWWIAGGERCGIGNGASAISVTDGVVTFTAATSMFRADDVDKTLVITDATTAANNGNVVITRYLSATQVQYVKSGAVSETYAKIFTIDGWDSSRGDSRVAPAISKYVDERGSEHADRHGRDRFHALGQDERLRWSLLDRQHRPAVEDRFEHHNGVHHRRRRGDACIWRVYGECGRNSWCIARHLLVCRSVAVPGGRMRLPRHSDHRREGLRIVAADP